MASLACGQLYAFSNDILEEALVEIVEHFDPRNRRQMARESGNLTSYLVELVVAEGWLVIFGTCFGWPRLGLGPCKLWRGPLGPDGSVVERKVGSNPENHLNGCLNPATADNGRVKLNLTGRVGSCPKWSPC